MKVVGSVNLAGTLSITPQFIAPGGTSFIIIDNDGTDPIVGTFAGLPEGATYTYGNLHLRVSYLGGTGNDVTLTTLDAFTISGSSIYIKKNTDTIHADITANGATNQVTISQASTFSITGTTGNDTLTLDFSNGNPLPATGLNFDGGAGVNTVAIIGTPGDDALTASATGLAFTGGTFSNVPITTASVQSLQFHGGSGGNDSINLTGGSYTIDADTPTGVPNVSVTVGPTAIANFATDQHLANLTLNGGVANLSNTRHSMYVNGLAISNNGLLDIANSFLYLNNTATSFATAKTYLDAAYNLLGPGNLNAPSAGDYKGVTGITSSVAKASYASDEVVGIGYYDGALQDPANPDSVGQIVGPNSDSGHGTGIAFNQILIRPTLTGDLNGDGVVNSYDVSLFNTYGLFNSGPTPLGWQVGDLNGDGVVNVKDVTVFNSVGNFNVGAFPPPAPVPSIAKPSIKSSSILSTAAATPASARIVPMAIAQKDTSQPHAASGTSEGISPANRPNLRHHGLDTPPGKNATSVFATMPPPVYSRSTFDGFEPSSDVLLGKFRKGKMLGR